MFLLEKDWKNKNQYQKFEDISFQRPVKFEDSEVEVGVDISSDRSILRKFIISQPFHKVSSWQKPFHKVGSKVDKNTLFESYAYRDYFWLSCFELFPFLSLWIDDDHDIHAILVKLIVFCFN